MEKLGYVDAMRGIAILAVILVHTALAVKELFGGLSGFANGLAEYGQMGVQLFFVASAYTLCISYFRRKGEPRPIVSFLIRRFFRIAPLYYVAIILYFLLHLVKQMYHRADHLQFYPYSFLNVVSNLAFVHGFVPPANNKIVPGGWSIGTEVAFYVCFPLLFYLANLLFTKREWLFLSVIALCVVMNIIVQYTLNHFSICSVENNTFIYYNLGNQLPVFLIGMLAFFLNYRTAATPLTSFIPYQVAGFIFFTVCALLLWGSRFVLAFAIIPVLSGASFFFLLNLLRVSPPRSYSCQIIIRIGKVSYSMYIFHFVIVFVLSKIAAKVIWSQMSSDIILIPYFISVCAITYLLANLTEKFIEKRGIAIGNSIVTRLHSRAAATAISNNLPLESIS